MKHRLSLLIVCLLALVLPVRAGAAATTVPTADDMNAVAGSNVTASPQAQPQLLVAQKGDHPRKESPRAITEDESLALTAIEGLMSAPPERAIPILKKTLNGSQSLLVKQRALFVVGQFDRPEATAILLDVARGAESPLRKEAIRSIGIGGNTTALAALNGIYAGGDLKVKREVLNAWMIAGRKAEVFQIATTAKDDKEVAEAIRMLSVMGATDELRKLGEMQKSSKHLVEAYAISGDLQSLRKIAGGTGELATRIEAVRSIGIVGNDAARQALREIYTGATEPQIRESALQGLLIANDQQGVLSLYRAAKSGDEKRKLLRTLSIMGGDAALEAIDAALEGKK